MPFSNGCFTPPELSARYQVPTSLVRRLIDRLGLGVHIGANRVVFAENLDAIELALKAMGKLPASETVQPESAEVGS